MTNYEAGEVDLEIINGTHVLVHSGEAYCSLFYCFYSIVSQFSRNVYKYIRA